MMQGYYKRPDATRAVLRDGVLHTGDLGRFDKESKGAASKCWIPARKSGFFVGDGVLDVPAGQPEYIHCSPANPYNLCVFAGDFCIVSAYSAQDVEDAVPYTHTAV